jgi:heme oxygenase (biliverdin-IX-beta and delta-forming)
VQGTEQSQGTRATVMAVPPSCLHQRLRAATGALHKQLERAVDIEAQLVSRERFIEYLGRLWGLHAAAEAALDKIDFTTFGFDYADRHKSLALERDLASLGVAPDSVAALPLPPPVTFATPEEGLGCVYVIEGSALGARAILPKIASALAIDAENGATYFSGRGTQGKPLWQACLKAVNAIEPESKRADRAIAGACATFAMFQVWLPERALETTMTAVPLT